MDLEGGLVEAAATAGVARHVDVGEEMHFHLDHAGAVAGFAPAALQVEAEPAARIAVQPGLLLLGEHFADEIEHLDVGGRIGTGRPADGLLVDVDDLVHEVQPLDAGVLPLAEARAVEPVGQRGVQGQVHQRALAGAGDAGDERQRAQREGGVDALKVVQARPAHCQPAFVGGPAPLGQRNLTPARQVLAGERGAAAPELRRRAGEHHLAAVNAGAGAEVDDVVGRGDGLPVVLHHHHRVAQVAQVFQRADEPDVVALVQADARLVENVGHARELRAHLGGQADALGLAAGQRRPGPLQRQVVEADVDQEVQPLGDLPDQLAGDLAAAAGQRQPVDDLPELPHRQAAHVDDALAVDPHPAGLAAQALAAAFGADRVGEVFHVVVAGLVGARLAQPPRQRVQDPLHLRLPAVLAGLSLEVKFDPLAAGAVQQDVELVRGQPVQGLVHGDVVMAADRLDGAPGPAGAVAHRSGPRRDGAVGQ